MHACVTMFYLRGFLSFQSAEEPEMPVASNSGLENAEKAIVPADSISPSSNAHLPSATIVPPTLMADNASTLASLRLVCSIVCLPLLLLVCLCDVRAGTHVYFVKRRNMDSLACKIQFLSCLYLFFLIFNG